ncbi:hypothetical protein ACHAWF_017972 [Thalassiosira exigua]
MDEQRTRRPYLPHAPRRSVRETGGRLRQKEIIHRRCMAQGEARKSTRSRYAGPCLSSDHSRLGMPHKPNSVILTAPSTRNNKNMPSQRPIHISRSRNRLNRYLFDKDWQSAIKEIERHPRETRMWSTQTEHGSRMLPIHVACSLHAPLRVVRAIVVAYPECLEKKESPFERLPIHTACQLAAPPDVIEYLVQAYAAGTLEPDNLGRLPLH